MPDEPFNKVFVSDGHKYGLIDPYNHLRAVSYDITGVAAAKKKWSWKTGECKIIRITLDKTGIHYGEVIE